MNVKDFTKSLERARKRAEDRHLEAAIAAYQRIIRKVGDLAASTLRAQSVTAAASWQPPPDGLLYDASTVSPFAERALSTTHKRIVASVVGAPLEQIGIAWDISHPLTENLLATAAKRTGQQLGEAVQPVLREAVQQAYTEGLSVRDAGALIRSKIEEASVWQAEMLARTDLNGPSNGGSVIAAKMAGIQTKTWLSASDGQVRPAHAAASGQTVPIDQPFQVGGESLAYPGDPAGSDGNVANCRCSVLFSEVAAKSQPQAAETLTLSAREEDAFRDYIGSGELGSGGYEAINRTLRGQTVSYGGKKARTLESISKMDAVMSRAPKMTQDQSFFRAFAEPGELPVPPERGATLFDRGFTSLFKEKSSAETWAGATGDVWEIQVPKGATALDLEKAGLNLTEREVLLPKNSTLEILSVTERQTKYPQTGRVITSRYVTARVRQ